MSFESCIKRDVGKAKIKLSKEIFTKQGHLLKNLKRLQQHQGKKVNSPKEKYEVQETVYFLYPSYIHTTIYTESLFLTNEALEIMYKPISVEMVVALL